MNTKHIVLAALGLYLVQNSCQESQTGSRPVQRTRTQDHPTVTLLDTAEEEAVINSLRDAIRRRDSQSSNSLIPPQHRTTFPRLPQYDMTRRTGLSLVSPDAAIQSSRAVGRLVYPDTQVTSIGNPVGAIGYNEDEDPRPSSAAPAAHAAPPRQQRRRVLDASIGNDGMPSLPSHIVERFRRQTYLSIPHGEQSLVELFSDFSQEQDQPER